MNAAPAVKTIGLSPKAVAAGITAYIAPIVAGWVANQLGVDVKADTATALLGPLVLAAVVFGASYLARIGLVHVDQDTYPDPDAGPNPPAKQ